jgi:Zn-dependent metalloprotease
VWRRGVRQGEGRKRLSFFILMSIFCMVPPHVLSEIAKNGNAAQRTVALDTLAVDASVRMQRMALTLLAPPSIVRPALLATAPPHAQRTIYTAGNREVEPGTRVRSEGEAATNDIEVDEAYDGLGHVFDFYLQKYQRNSIDDQGLPLVATVHYGLQFDNAFWDGQQMVFGDGDGTIFNRFTIALDVIGHELTHGVTEDEAGLVYMGQPGALNESISDVFGSLIKQFALNQTADVADWLVGAGLLTFKDQALRSMKAPGTAYDNQLMGKDPQPADMRHYVHTASDNGGVHLNSGIPNRAFYLVAAALGGHAWEKAGQIWYDTVRDKNLRRTATFSAFAGRTVSNAKRRYGNKSAEKKAVVDAWHTVGVKLA